MWGHHLGCVFKEDGSPLGRANPLCQDPICVSVKFFASPPWQDLAIDYPRSRLGGLEIFHINTLIRGLVLLRRLASKSSVHMTKLVFASICLDNVSFYKFCLFMCRL